MNSRYSGLEAPAAPDEAAAPPGYLWDAREAAFVLWEFFRLDHALLGRPPFARATRAAVEELVAGASGHARRLAEAYAAADRAPARRVADDEVAIHESFPALWREHARDWFWLRQQADFAVADDQHDVRFPMIVAQCVMEQFLGANPSFMMYCGFTPAAASLIRLRGSDRQREVFLDKLDRIEWDATFCATEAEAGSDLSAVRTSAERLHDDVYAISGEKLYITAGMHPLTQNTVHLVIGRMKDAPRSSLSLSCFLVPRYWQEDDGSLVPNHVACAEVADKLGFNGCANTRLVFGSGGTTRAFLLGDRANVGLLQVAPLMNRARIYTGLQAVALASSAYLHALRHARRRVQGAAFDAVSNPQADKLAIVRHLDVQRMLLDMKARVEGGRLVIGRISMHVAHVQHQQLLEACDSPDFDADELDRHERLLSLYGPIGKAYVSEEAWNVATDAIQVHGAVGYLRSRPLEQYARDLKVLTIWEGTTFVQAQQFLRDRLDFGRRSLVLAAFMDEVSTSLGRAANYPELTSEFAAMRARMSTLATLLGEIARRADAGRVLELSQFCTRVLNAFGDVVVAWNLLEAACVAVDANASPEGSPGDRAFYSGKVKTARWFIHNVLPRIETLARALRCTEATLHADSDEFGFLDPAGADA